MMISSIPVIPVAPRLSTAVRRKVYEPAAVRAEIVVVLVSGDEIVAVRGPPTCVHVHEVIVPSGSVHEPVREINEVGRVITFDPPAFAVGF